MWTALWALALACALALAVWYRDVHVSEVLEGTIFMKETADGEGYLYVENQEHMLRLKCGADVDFNSIRLTDQDGTPYFYRLSLRWNRRTGEGTVSSCETTGELVLGSYEDVEFEVLEAPLWDCSTVYYQDESRRQDPFSSQRRYLSDYRFWTEAGGTILKVEDCLSAVPADADGDGENEVVVRTRWPEEPYMVYDREDGELVCRWLREVSPELREQLVCIWEE